MNPSLVEQSTPQVVLHEKWRSQGYINGSERDARYLGARTFMNLRESRQEHLIVICGEVFSPNLGDGVIARSVDFLIKSNWPAIQTTYLDLSGRTEHSHQLPLHRDSILRRLRIHPTSIKRLNRLRTAVSWLSGRKRWVSRAFANGLLGSPSMVVFCGGHLLIDNDLNFPFKLYVLLRQIGKRGIPVVFNACGASRHWSAFARWLITSGLGTADVESLSFRDGASLRNFRANVGYPSEENTYLSADAAVWAADAFGITRTSSDKAKTIGVGVVHPSALQKHADDPSNFLKKQQINLYVEIVRLLVGKGFHPTFFTNGEAADEAFLSAVLQQCPRALRDRVTRSATFHTPEDFVEGIRHFSGIIAHRLHANIVAYALTIPTVGLVWDAKVRDFGEISGRADFFIEPDGVSAENVVGKLEIALSSPFPHQRLAELKALSSDNLLRAIKSALFKNQ